MVNSAFQAAGVPFEPSAFAVAGKSSGSGSRASSRKTPQGTKIQQVSGTVGVARKALRNCFKNGSRPRKPRENKHFARFLKQSLMNFLGLPG